MSAVNKKQMAVFRRRSEFGNHAMGSSLWSQILVFTTILAVCNPEQIDSSSLNIHPVAKLPSERLATANETNINDVLMNSRISSRRSLSTPISVPTISNAKRVVEAVNQSTSLSKGNYKHLYRYYQINEFLNIICY